MPNSPNRSETVKSPAESPFFIGEGRSDRLGDQLSPSTSSPSVSRPSTAGTNGPFSSPAGKNIDPSSRVHTPSVLATQGGYELEVPSRVSIAARAGIPRVASYYGSPPTNLPSRNSSALRVRESFAAPFSRPLTANSTVPSLTQKRATRMRSTLLDDPSTIEKPWISKKDPYARVAYFLTYGVAFLGILASAARCYLGYKSVPTIKGNLCMVLDEEFNTDTDTIFGSGGNWFREIELGGFGNGEFEMTTSSSNNSYVQDGYLYITPTLTSDIIGMDNVLNGYTFNLTDCTYNDTNPEALPGGSNSSTPDANAYYQACGAVSNSTSGTVINPVQSARITTRNSASIRYGRVEVRAKLPRGDWLWPAIWMLPVNNTYGPWPLSGEIDIMEARGNARSYPNQGVDYVRGSLNWGPLSFLNAYYKTFGWWTQRRTDYGEAFHTYVLEWTPSFLRIYVDSRLNYMLQLSFNEPFFTRGNFPSVVENGSTPIVLQNPWVNGTNATPFDQREHLSDGRLGTGTESVLMRTCFFLAFYLVLDLAVGSTSGWFPDNVGSKPWLDGSNIAMRQFTIAQDQWYPTWGSNGESSSFIMYVAVQSLIPAQIKC
ncbi:glycoside hydrolase family 16 protein [Boletus reticuloceps]|uniref:Glycoside hydrolase family 16 protein n=1 Tax=Boletus reticuloceps TaxID=495285 RepID=A0A8I3AC84_9AGAM|nr:glycoside hydrolase family 16 protein [Boletus reticuloceps]